MWQKRGHAKKSRAPINHDNADDADEDTDDDAEDDAEDDAGHDQKIGGKRIMTSVSPTSLPNPNSLNYKTRPKIQTNARQRSEKMPFLAEVYSDFQACHFSDTLGPDNNKCSYRWQLSQISSLKHFCYFIKGGPAQIPATFDLGCKACWWERRGETQIRIQYNTYWNANKQRNTNTSNVWLGMQSLLAELSFVTTIATGSRVKFVPAV